MKFDKLPYRESLNKIAKIFPRAFINMRNELILEEKSNIYFILENVENDFDFKCKMIAWLSRPSCKGSTDKKQAVIRKGFNGFFETEFTENEMRDIYTILGNGCNKKICDNFIKSGYDLDILGYKDNQ